MATVRLNEEQLKTLKGTVLAEQVHYLSEELGDPGRYFPFLKSKGILDADDCDRIRAKETTRERVEKFVEQVHKRQSSRGDPAFDVLVDALKRQKVQAHIARVLQRAFARRKGEEERKKSAEIRQQSDNQSQHTPTSDIGTPVSIPVQATNSRCNTPSRELAQNTPLQSTSPSTEDRRGSSCSATSQSQYDIHPQHGAIPPPLTAEMQQRVHSLRQPSPSKDVDPNHGLLPPHPPTSSAGLTTPRPETGGAHQDIFEPGMQTVHPHTTPTSSGPRSPQGSSATAASTQYQKQYLPNSDEPVCSGAQGQSEGQPPSFDSVDGSVTTQISDSSVLTSLEDFHSTDGKARVLEEHVLKLQEENSRLRIKISELQRQLEVRNSELRDVMNVKASTQRECERLQQELEEVKDYDELQKELQQVKEKLHHVTLSYHEHNYETMQHSDLDDYFELKEESGKLLKQVEEQKSQMESMDRENQELRTQVEDFHRQNQHLVQQVHSLSFRNSMQNHAPNSQSRPHHLPITSPGSAVGSRPPSNYEVRDTPLSMSGITPLRSIHVGDQLSRHNIHLQQTSPIPPSSQRHSVDGCLTPAGDSLSLRSSNTSISSHGSNALPSWGTSAQTTLV